MCPLLESHLGNLENFSSHSLAKEGHFYLRWLKLVFLLQFVPLPTVHRHINILVSASINAVMHSEIKEIRKIFMICFAHHAFTGRVSVLVLILTRVLIFQYSAVLSENDEYKYSYELILTLLKQKALHLRVFYEYC